MERTDPISVISYESLAFDEDGFWDSEQLENELPIQFWRGDVPTQEHLDVLLKAWNNIDTDISMVLGDQEDFDTVIKRVFHNDHFWLVRWSGNMAVREIKMLSDAQPLPFFIDMW